MRTKIILLFSIISLTVNAQRMETINETVANLFIATDNRDWPKVEAIFADNVELDYSSMTGNPAIILTPKQITDGWKTILPGFTYTHHQIGNIVTKVEQAKAEVFCYGTATHYLADSAGNVWTVIGTYNFELQKTDEIWKISKMKFNFKFQDGNVDLPKKAIENFKK